MECGFDIAMSQEDKYDFVISIASGKYDFKEIFNWIETHLKKSKRH